MVKLFVGGFPLEFKEIDLAKLFALHGDISTLKIVCNKKTNICKGYAFIEMVDRAGAEGAVEALNGTIIQDKALTVKINEDPVIEPSPFLATSTYVRTLVRQNKDKSGAVVKKKRPRIIT